MWTSRGTCVGFIFDCLFCFLWLLVLTCPRDSARADQSEPKASPSATLRASRQGSALPMMYLACARLARARAVQRWNICDKITLCVVYLLVLSIALSALPLLYVERIAPGADYRCSWSVRNFASNRIACEPV